jgi:site-specific recombinase XerD
MNPTTLHQAEPKARSSDLIPAHIAEELRRFDTHLRDVRGLAAETRKHRIRVAGLLLRQTFNDRAIDIGELQPSDVREFLATQWEKRRTVSQASYLAAALRSYFRYRATCGDSV